MARRLGELARPPLLIAVTGEPMSWDRKRAGAAGFVVYFIKPVPAEELVAVLTECDAARTETV